MSRAEIDAAWRRIEEVASRKIKWTTEDLALALLDLRRRVRTLEPKDASAAHARVLEDALGLDGQG